MLLKNAKGFTLIELMVVVAIVAILASVAIPSYTKYGFRARRADGREMVMRIAAAEERFYTNGNTYTASLSALGFSSGLSEKGYYSVVPTIANGGQTYLLTATPQGIQASDQCTKLKLDNVGARTYNGTVTNGTCW